LVQAASGRGSVQGSACLAPHRMKQLSLPKAVLLRAPWEYRRVYEKGKRIRGPQLTIVHLPNGGEDNRLGISIHGVKSAVRRNKVKRIIREFFRLNRNFLTPSVDIVFAVRSGFTPDSPAAVQELVASMLRRGAGKKGESGRS
jgi:ribonuclease P protein component